MVRKLKALALAGALMAVATPVFADDLFTPLAPIVAPIMAPFAGIDMDPLHIFTPAPAPVAAPAPMMKKHHAHHHMKKKMSK